MYNLETLNLSTANSDSSVTNGTQTSFANFLPRSLQKRYWSKDSRLESINNAILLNQRHYASILGNPAVNQIAIKQQASKPSLLWPSHSFTENNRPLSSANNSRLSRYCSSSFRTLLPTPNDTNNNASNLSTVSFELTDENSLLQSPPSSQLARGLTKAKTKAYPRNNSINYIFLKPDEHKICKQGSLVGANPRNSANLSGIDSTGVNNQYISNTGCNLNSTTFMSISNYKTLTPEFLRSNTATEVNTKSTSRTTNELFALKDINYYVTSTSQSGAKRHGLKTETEAVAVANEGNSIKVNSTSQITPLTPSQQQHHTAENARRTRSALPLLRNNIKYSKTISALPSKDINANNSNSDASKQENHLTVNLNTCFNATSYKLVNSPLLNNLNRTKKILCNASNAPAVVYEKKLREN